MKNLILALVVIATLPAAHAAGKNISLDYTTVVKLDELSADSVRLTVNYPGLGDNALCGLEIRTHNINGTVDALFSAVKIKNAFGDKTQKVSVRNANTIDIDLRRSTYVDGVVISTHYGTSLKSAIEQALGMEGIDPEVIVIAKACQ